MSAKYYRKVAAGAFEGLRPIGPAKNGGEKFVGSKRYCFRVRDGAIEKPLIILT